MKIGIIGFSESVEEMLENTSRLSFSGCYTSGNIASEAYIKENLKEYTSARELIDQSDVLFINNDPEAFEIAKNAIKKSTHLLFESPFLFSETEFNELFELAHENNVLLKFNQKILQKEIYKKISSRQEPGLIKFRTDYPDNNAPKIQQKQVVFEFASILRDNIKSGIRKINISKDKQSGKYFSLIIHMDNDSSCELLFNTIAPEKRINLELFYPNRLVSIDFMNDKMISGNQKGTKIKEANQKPNLMRQELEDFKTHLSKIKSMPITIREENQYLLYFTYRLAEKVFRS
jgi:hypothetical protein